MNEQEQAEILATWLESDGEIPKGLDDDVVEAVLALQPQRAPVPQITADDILATVSTGPLASPIPANASVGLPPSLTPTPKKRWWFIGALSIGGLSSLVAAALVMLALGTSVLQDEGQAPREPAHNEIAAAPARAQPTSSKRTERDSGIQSEERLRRVAAKPTAKKAPRPSRARPTTQKSSSEAVVFAEDELEQDLSDRTKGDLDEARIPELGDSNTAKIEPTELDSFGGPPPPPAMEVATTEDPTPPSNAPQDSEDNRKSKADTMVPPSPPPAAEPSPTAGRLPPTTATEGRSREAKQARPAKPTLAPITPRTGTESVHNPAVDQAIQALAAGDPSAALQTCIQGLSIHTKPSPTRQLLLALKGDAHAALGDIQAAKGAWSQAKKIARKRKP